MLYSRSGSFPNVSFVPLKLPLVKVHVAAELIIPVNKHDKYHWPALHCIITVPQARHEALACFSNALMSLLLSCHVMLDDIISASAEIFWKSSEHP